MSIIERSAGHLVENVQPGLWRIVFHLPTSTNCWLFQESDGLTMVDAGCPWNAGTILNTIRQVDVPLKRIVITHAHPDHAGAAAQVARETGAIVYAHASEVPYLKGNGSIADSAGSVISSNLHKAAQSLGLLAPPVIGDVKPLTDGDCVGGLRVIHVPGHTPGSISLWAEDEKALFIGDNASNRMHRLHINWSWFTLDFDVLQASFERYHDYPAKMLLVGHGYVHRSHDAVQDLIQSIPKRRLPLKI